MTSSFGFLDKHLLAVFQDVDDTKTGWTSVVLQDAIKHRTGVHVERRNINQSLDKLQGYHLVICKSRSSTTPLKTWFRLDVKPTLLLRTPTPEQKRERHVQRMFAYPIHIMIDGGHIHNVFRDLDSVLKTYRTKVACWIFLDPNQNLCHNDYQHACVNLTSVRVDYLSGPPVKNAADAMLMLYAGRLAQCKEAKIIHVVSRDNIFKFLPQRIPEPHYCEVHATVLQAKTHVLYELE